MDWRTLSASSSFEDALQASYAQPVLVFKHSYRCSISAVVYSRLKRDWNLPEAEVATYLVDVVKDRNLSLEVAERLHIRHESPQALLLRDGACIYHSSHMAVTVSDLTSRLGSER